MVVGFALAKFGEGAGLPAPMSPRCITAENEKWITFYEAQIAAPNGLRPERATADGVRLLGRALR